MLWQIIIKNPIALTPQFMQFLLNVFPQMPHKFAIDSVIPGDEFI